MFHQLGDSFVIVEGDFALFGSRVGLGNFEVSRGESAEEFPRVRLHLLA